MSFADAHSAAQAAVDGVWDAIVFGEATEKVPLQEGAAEGVTKEPQAIEDQAGNCKLTMPAGWNLEIAPTDDGKRALRFLLVRLDANGNEAARFTVARFESARAATFNEDTPGDVVQRFIGGKNLEGVYGEGSTPHLTPMIDESSGLGGADKSAKWKISSVTMEQKKARREAETKKRRGEKASRSRLSSRASRSDDPR